MNIIKAYYDHILDIFMEVYGKSIESAQPGNCMKVTSLSLDILRDLYTRLSLLNTETLFYILTEDPGMTGAEYITPTKLIELRNDLTKSILVLIPVNSSTSAEDSYGNATFRELSISDFDEILYKKLQTQLSGKQRANADEFLSAFDFDWMSMSPIEATQKLLDSSGYIQMWRESKDVDASDRLDNIRELITNVIAKYDTLPEFLEHAALMMTDDNDTDDTNPTSDFVSIMTIHAAKGLEFDTVFLPAWEEGIFPNDMAIQSGSLEEERRLAYVAITRARKRAIIINAMSRLVFGNKEYNSSSRFITEMDNKYLDFQGGAPRSYQYNYNMNRGMPTSYTSTPKPKRAPVQHTSAVGRLVEHQEMGRGVVIEENEAEMIQNIMEFSETEAQDIMTHRKNINALEENTTLEKALEFMVNNSNSRYPVYREDIDHIVGILHLKDAMRQIAVFDCKELPIRRIPNLIREASYIPETRNINELFKAMQAKKIHMTIVVDEYGQTSGLVTMEDILEEIVGNILDEYDEEEQFIHVQTDDSLIMEGFTPLEQVDEVLGSDFDESEEFDTLNGYLTSVLGHVPDMTEDKEIKAKGYLFTILAVENNTIQKVRVENLPEEEKGEETCQDIQNSQT